VTAPGEPAPPAPRTPTGTTALYAVIGDPVRHSLSPVLHNAAFAALGVDAVYVALPVPSGSGAAAVRAMPTLGIRGLNVTMPHKADAAAACDELTDDAARLGAANTVTLREDGTLLGDSTDGEGFVRSLLDEGLDPAGRRVAVIGAGGAARSVVLALGRRGAAVTVRGRRPEAAAATVALAPGAVVGPPPADADLVVNATPLGMDGRSLPWPVADLPATAVVVDLVYHPAETPWLAAARAAGRRTVNGLGMLLHQAALADERWTGRPAPIGAMRAAVEHALAAR
jgi:shikimate dehydrogenase